MAKIRQMKNIDFEDKNKETVLSSAKRNINSTNSDDQGQIRNLCENFRQKYLQSAVYQLIIFIIFLIVLSFVTFGMTSSSRYHMTRAISIKFLQRHFGRGILFEEISSVEDIWTYLEEIAVPVLFPLVMINENYTITKYIFDGNMLLGIPRLKQLRVRNDSCRIHQDFRALIRECYAAYSKRVEDKRPFGLGNGTAWIYNTDDDLSSTSYWGVLHYYSGSGSYEDLGVNLQDPFLQLSSLRNNSWISLATRIVVLDFTLYNADVNLFSVVKLVMELSAGGGVWASKYIRTVNLLRYVNAYDYFILALEFLFCALTVYYFIVEIIEIYSQGLRYFLIKWNWVDSIILIVSIICIGFGIYRTVLIDTLLKHLLINPKIFPNFERLGFWQVLYDASTALLVFLSWIKIFKYLSFNETMVQLSTTLTKCAKDVGGFAVMFFIIFLAYAQLGYLLFGSQLLNFSRVETSVFTLMRLILGDFDYDSLESANRIMGPIFFVTFVLFVFVILLNMFLAILSDTYTSVKAEMDEEGGHSKLRIGDFFKAILSKCLHLFKKKGGINESSSQNNAELDGFDAELKHGKRSDDSEATLEEKKTAIITEAKGERDSIHISVKDFEKLSIRVDDLRHEMEQIQRAIIVKMALISRNFERLTESFPQF